MSAHQKEEKRLRNLEYAKRFKKKKKKKAAQVAPNPFILMAHSTGPFPATCARCGKQTELPFRPTGTRPVYCDGCFALVRSGLSTGLERPYGPVGSEPVSSAGTSLMEVP